MPTREPILNTLIPREAEKVIPVRVVSTRVGPRPKPPEATAGDAAATGGASLAAAAGGAPSTTNRDHSSTDRSDAAAASATTAESVKLSPQLTAIARKEQAFRSREQALKEREKVLEGKLADADRFAALKAKLSAKDFSDVEALGLTYEEYTNFLLAKQNGEKPETQAFKKLETEIETLKKNQEENAQAQFDETVSEYRKEIASLVSTDPQFSTVKEEKREDAVLQLILDSWEEDNEEVTVEQAARDIEEFLVAEGLRMAQTTKVRARLGETEKKPLPPPRPGLKTLTQQVTTTGSEKRPVKPLHSLSDSERYAEARRRVLERREQEQRNR